VGLQIFTDVQGQPLDSPQFLPVFELAAKRDVPVWLHPTRSPRRADYLTESRSKYDIWWALGWPYETSICMARLVFSGVFDRWPELKILTHHMGGMVPYFEGRVGWGLDQLGTRTDEPEDLVARARLKRRPLEYFRRFYADTALYGSVAAVECGVAFFGAQRVLFGTDFPFDPQHGTEREDLENERFERYRDRIRFLADLVAGRVPGRTEAAQVTLLNKNWGLGIEFAAVAHVVYQRAKAAGAGRPLPGEWFSQFSHP
jgi:predicted TIM-barrel fold metal-dependent hydrolase